MSHSVSLTSEVEKICPFCLLNILFAITFIKKSWFMRFTKCFHLVGSQVKYFEY